MSPLTPGAQHRAPTQLCGHIFTARLQPVVQDQVVEVALIIVYEIDNGLSNLCNSSCIYPPTERTDSTRQAVLMEDAIADDLVDCGQCIQCIVLLISVESVSGEQY